MSTAYLWLKYLHIVSSTVLLGTAAGIAFFFVRAHATRDVRVIAAVARHVVIADVVFTASAVVVQPLTGIALAMIAGYSLSAPWLQWSIALYLLIGACWLPVVWLQIRMRNLAVTAATQAGTLPPQYAALYRWWTRLGWPAFLGVLIVFYLMIARPT
jgi:uncharacterized membrane protein